MVPLKSAKCFCVGWAIKTNFWNRKKLRVCLSKFEFEIRIRNFVFQNVDPLPPWKLYPVRFWNQNPRNRDQSGTGSSMGGRAAAIPIWNLVWRRHTNPRCRYYAHCHTKKKLVISQLLLLICISVQHGLKIARTYRWCTEITIIHHHYHHQYFYSEPVIKIRKWCITTVNLIK